MPGDWYVENFNDGLAQNWTLSQASVVNAQLALDNWNGSSQGFYAGQTFSAPYLYKVDLSTSAGSDGNKLLVLFNYASSRNYYFLEIGGGAPNTVALKKKVNNGVSTISTYPGSYTITGLPTTFEVLYESGGTITIVARQYGMATTLFNHVQDTALTSGKVGVGGSYMAASADNVIVDPSPDGPTPTPTPAGPTPTPGPTATPTPTTAPSTVMHVQNIAMSSYKQGPRYGAQALVTIVDANNAPVASATVSGQFTGATNNTCSEVTNGSGQATCTSSGVSGGGTWTFCVTNVVKSGWTYNANANVETCDSITAP
jgi:hypothetical protein